MDIVTELRKAICEAAEIPAGSLADDVPLDQQGITSLQVVAAYVRLERDLDISFRCEELPSGHAATSTIAEVAKAIEAIHVRR